MNFKELTKDFDCPWLSSYDALTPANMEYYDSTMFRMFEDICKAYPDRICLDYMNAEISYGQVYREVCRCMQALRACGIEAGDSVSVCLPNIPQAVYLFYAALGIGAVANMIHPLSAKPEIAYCVNLSSSKILFVLNAFFENATELPCPTLQTVVFAGADDCMKQPLKFGFRITKGRKIKKITESERVISWRTFCGNGEKKEAMPDTKRGPNDLAVILYSGGTTGKQKGIMLSHLNFNALAAQILAMGAPDYRNIPNLSILALLPMFHGFGLGVCIHAAISCGAKILLVPVFNGDSFAKLLKKKKPSFIAGVPTLFEALLRKNRLKGVDFSNCHGIFCGGGSLPPALKHDFDRAIKPLGAKVEIREGYGLTECVTASALIPISKYKEGSFGVPFPDTLYKIVRPGTEETVPFGTQGEICIAGPSVMLGYLNDPEETAQVLRKHADGRIWLHTGDVGYMDADGFFFFTSRIKRMVKVSGYSVYPNQIEDVITEHEKVALCCVIGVPDDYKMNRLKAFVVVKDGFTADARLEEEIRLLCRKNLARYSQPKEIEFRDSLPMTKVGKIAYTVLEEESAATTTRG